MDKVILKLSNEHIHDLVPTKSYIHRTGKDKELLDISYQCKICGQHFQEDEAQEYLKDQCSWCDGTGVISDGYEDFHCYHCDIDNLEKKANVNSNLIEYTQQELFKKKRSPDKSIQKVIDIFNGQDNYLLGGKVDVTFDELKDELYRQKVQKFLNTEYKDEALHYDENIQKSFSDAYGLDFDDFKLYLNKTAKKKNKTLNKQPFIVDKDDTDHVGMDNNDITDYHNYERMFDGKPIMAGEKEMDKIIFKKAEDMIDIRRQELLFSIGYHIQMIEMELGDTERGINNTKSLRDRIDQMENHFLELEELRYKQQELESEED